MNLRLCNKKYLPTKGAKRFAYNIVKISITSLDGFLVCYLKLNSESFYNWKTISLLRFKVKFTFNMLFHKS